MSLIALNTKRSNDPQKPNLKVWKIIKLGTIKKRGNFREEIKKAGFKIDEWVNHILGNLAFTVAWTEQDIELVKLSVADLGFEDGAKYGDVCAKAKELGLELCPNEVGFQLRLQYKDQPKGDCLYIAMEPVSDLHGNLVIIFLVGHGNKGMWLHGIYGTPNSFCAACDDFIFRLRK